VREKTKLWASVTLFQIWLFRCFQMLHKMQANKAASFFDSCCRMWKITVLTSLSLIVALDTTWEKTDMLHTFWLLGQLKKTCLVSSSSTLHKAHTDGQSTPLVLNRTRVTTIYNIFLLV
jgi:hypothetical protein